MKLSELVGLKEEIRSSISIDKIDYEISQLSKCLSKLEGDRLDRDLIPFFTKTTDELNRVRHEIANSYENLKTIYSAIDHKISSLSSKFFAANYQLELELDTAGERLTRKKLYSDATREVLVSRLRKHSNWHYPALEIGPGDGVWTEELVENDPLYIVDLQQEYLDETLKKFNPVYQRRIRPYLVPFADNENLSMLPQNQFGFVASINVFDYFSFDKIRRYLASVYDVLRPGGVFLFTYGNCDRREIAELAEKGSVGYMPKSLLVAFCETHGYEVLDSFDLDQTVSWIEIRKPGELKTVKGHQAMGEIKFKTS